LLEKAGPLPDFTGELDEVPKELALMWEQESEHVTSISGPRERGSFYDDRAAHSAIVVG
jgi:hypothetical protein